MSASAVSAAVQDYLKVIWLVQECCATSVSTNMLSDPLGVAPSSVSERIRRLTGLGLVVHRMHGAIALTTDRRRLAVAMVRLSEFFRPPSPLSGLAQSRGLSL